MKFDVQLTETFEWSGVNAMQIAGHWTVITRSNDNQRTVGAANEKWVTRL
jgi:hypothetical protein